MVFAVVRTSGRQEKVEVGSIITVNRVSGDNKGKLELPAVLLVDGNTVTTDAAKLAKVKVTAEVLNDLRGPKIVIQRYKNKTGYKSRQGHRQDLTRIKITGIGSATAAKAAEKPAAEKPAAEKPAAKTTAAKTTAAKKPAAKTTASKTTAAKSAADKK